MSSKKRGRDQVLVVAGSSKSSSESAFVGNEVYVNRIPDPPCEGKMIRPPSNLSRFVSYHPTTLESRYRFNLLEDSTDCGLNLNTVDVLAWESPWARLESTMPPAKRRKHAETDPSTTSSISSYYNHYLKKRKAEILSNSITASKYGKVAAADLTIPFEDQLKAIPKEHQIALYSRDVLASITTGSNVPNASAVPWLKRTEYIVGREDSSQNYRMIIPTSIDELDNLELLEELIDDNSPSSSNTFDETMGDDFMMEGDETDQLIENLAGETSSQRRKSLQSPHKSGKDSSKDMLASPFHSDPNKYIRAIEASFKAILSRSSIVHPSRLQRTSLVSSAKEEPTIVEEWDIFPNEDIWDNNYFAVQSDVPPPSSNLLLTPLAKSEHSLLTLSKTAAEENEAHEAAMNTEKKKKEIIGMYAPDPENPEQYDYQNVWEAEVSSLRPAFDTSGSFIFMLNPTKPYDADDDEENGIHYEAEDENQTLQAQEKKRKSLANAKVGIATFKNLDGFIHLKTPSAATRQEAAKIEHPKALKIVKTNIPDSETYMRSRSKQTLQEPE